MFFAQKKQSVFADCFYLYKRYIFEVIMKERELNAIFNIIPDPEKSFGR